MSNSVHSWQLKACLLPGILYVQLVAACLFLPHANKIVMVEPVMLTCVISEHSDGCFTGGTCSKLALECYNLVIWS